MYRLLSTRERLLAKQPIAFQITQFRLENHVFVMLSQQERYR